MEYKYRMGRRTVTLPEEGLLCVRRIRSRKGDFEGVDLFRGTPGLEGHDKPHERLFYLPSVGLFILANDITGKAQQVTPERGQLFLKDNRDGIRRENYVRAFGEPEDPFFFPLIQAEEWGLGWTLCGGTGEKTKKTNEEEKPCTKKK